MTISSNAPDEPTIDPTPTLSPAEASFLSWAEDQVQAAQARIDTWHASFLTNDASARRALAEAPNRYNDLSWLTFAQEMRRNAAEPGGIAKSMGRMTRHILGEISRLRTSSEPAQIARLQVLGHAYEEWLDIVQVFKAAPAQTATAPTAVAASSAAAAPEAAATP